MKAFQQFTAKNLLAQVETLPEYTVPLEFNVPQTPSVGDRKVTVEIDGEESEYAGWFNGKNEKCVKVEIIFDYMCPGCKRHLTGIPVVDSLGNQVDTINIFQYLEQEKLDDGTSYLDAIDLSLTPFPFFGHPFTDEQIQTYLVLR